MHGIYSGTLLSIVVPDKRRTLSNARFYSNLVSCPRIRILSLRSKWAAGKAQGGRISRAIRNRRATQPPAHFHRNPPGRCQLAVFPRCSLLTYRFRYDRRYRQSGSDRLEKQPTDLRRKACLFRGQDTDMTTPHAYDIVIAGHGSRDPEGLAEFESLVRLVQERSPGRRVAHGYLEFARPTIGEVVREKIAAGVDRIAIVPGLLLAATHAKNDIPNEVQALQLEFPNAN